VTGGNTGKETNEAVRRFASLSGPKRGEGRHFAGDGDRRGIREREKKEERSEWNADAGPP